jgi:parvulin-like peptidyl-prolyl isomerase
MALAQDVARRAQSGENFCELVTQYSDDTSTRDKCGSHGPQPMAGLLPAIQSAARTMRPGSVSGVLPVQIGQDQVLLILMPMGEASVPSFEDVKNDMMQRALLEGLDRARKQWLQELRRNVYVDVRL